MLSDSAGPGGDRAAGDGVESAMRNNKHHRSNAWRRHIVPGMLLATCAAAAVVVLPPASARPRDSAPVTMSSTTSSPSASSWRTDPAWHQGKAEWAVYDAEREIYGTARTYEATIFTNQQHMDPATTVKAADASAPGTIAVFKHNVSEIVPTDNYDYRFLTTAFVRSDTLEPYKIVASTQEDCGASYKQFVFDGGDGGQVRSLSAVYFPGAGLREETWRLPGMSRHFRFHDDLTLTLRDFPFDAPEAADVMMKLIADQTNTRETPGRWAEAQVHYEGRVTLDVPYGQVDAHHLRVTHEPMGGVSESHYWFAAEREAMRHVLVQYRGPYGVSYRLKRLDWWAYWSDPKPE